MPRMAAGLMFQLPFSLPFQFLLGRKLTVSLRMTAQKLLDCFLMAYATRSMWFVSCWHIIRRIFQIDKGR